MPQPHQKDLVSVILPAFNAAQYVRETIHSVLAQTYPFLELIVVDDGSTDETSRIVRDLATKDARIRLIQQPNGGVGAARNRAIEYARGTYIAPLDADDVWSPEKLEKQVARMEERGARTGMIYCWSRNISADGEVLGYSYPYTVEGWAHRAMLLRNFSGNGSVPLFRATALKTVGLYLSRDEQRGAQGFEDWDLSLRISEKFEVGVAQDYLVDYRQSRVCMSTNARSMAASFEVAIRRARERNPHLPPNAFRWAMGNFYYYITRKSFAWHHYRACIACLRKAVWADPILLLNLHTYRMIGRSMLHEVSGGRLKHPMRNGRATPRSRPDVSIANRKTAVFPNRQRIWGRVLSRRWSAALAETVD